MHSALSMSAEGNLPLYLREIRGFPLLDPATEAALARRWRDHGDRQAADRIVASHLRLVVKIAKGYRGYRLPLSDLIAEGNYGLMQAIERFDPDREVRFSTYASWWIRAEIQGHVLRSASLVRMGTTGAQKKLFFNLARLKARYGAFEDGDLSPETVAAIAKDLEVNETEVIEMNRRLAGGEASLNASPGDEFGTEFQDLLADESADQEATLGEAEEMAHRRTMMSEALKKLSDRERHILTERRLREQPPTLEVLSRRYGVSRERIRQIEARAFAKLQKAMTRAQRAFGLPKLEPA